MTGKFELRKYRVSRWKQLIFPQELIIDETHVLTRKRHFPAFWVMKEESIPLSKVASIQIIRGLFFSTLVIENSGGPFPITLNGLYNNKASEVRKTLETYERMIKERESSAPDEPDKPGENEKKTNKLLSLLIKPAKKADTYQSFNFKLEDDKPLEAWWKEPEAEGKDVSESEKTRNYSPETWEMPVITPPIRKIDLLEERIDEIDEKAKKSGWISDLIKNPYNENPKT